MGIYFVEQLGGTGYTDYVQGSDGKPSHAYVVLDAAVLNALQANAWATWKENTPFKMGSPNSDTLRATIAEPEHNNRKSAIQDLLLAHQHEARGRSDADAGALLGRGALHGQAQAPGSHFDWKLSAK